MRTYLLDARTATPHFPGIGRYVSNLARALVPLLTAGERLIVLCDRHHRLSLPDHASAEILEVAASPFSLRQQWAIPSLLRRAGADLYHSAYYLMPYRPGVPTIVTLYDLIPILFPEYSSRRARRLFRWMTGLALRAADQTIAISQATLDDVRAHFAISPDAIRVIPLAPDPAFRPQDYVACARVRQVYGLPKDYVLYVGSNKPHKNLVRLVEAWHQVWPELREHILVIAGAWSPDYPEPRRRAAALGLGAEAVHWPGRVREADLPALYAGATLFVFPSLYEGFGLPVVEAMACGTPVACSDIPPLQEVAGEAALTFDPVDPGSIAGALGKALHSPALLTALREQGLAQAAQFSWHSTAMETLALYRQVAPRGERSARGGTA